MTVKELIEQLKKYPDDCTVTIENKTYDDDDYGYEHLCIDEIYKCDYDKVIIEVW